MKILKIKVIFLVTLFCFPLFAQSLPGSKTDAHLPDISVNDFKEKGFDDSKPSNPTLKNKTDQLIPFDFKALANKDKVTLQWIFKDEMQNADYKVYRSEGGRDHFVMISSSESNPRLNRQSALTAKNQFHFDDLAVVPGITYWYKLICTDENESSVENGPISASLPIQRTLSNRVITTSPKTLRFESVSNKTSLSATTLHLDLPYYIKPHHPTKISIYGPKGERVKTIYKGPMEAGSYELIWNGDTERGEMVNGGIFFAVFENDLVKEATKLILIK